jgi:hypothetical protein
MFRKIAFLIVVLCLFNISVCQAQMLAGRAPTTSQVAGSYQVTDSAAVTNFKTIWIGSPVNTTTGLAVNTSVVLIGTTDNKVIALQPTDFKGFSFTMKVDANANPNKFYIQIFTTGDYVEWMCLP